MGHHNDSRTPWLTQGPYASSPTPPPGTDGEYLVCWRRPHWPKDRRDGRQVFHTHAAAHAYRAKLERGERQAHSLPTDAILVAIYWRPCREWREIA